MTKLAYQHQYTTHQPSRLQFHAKTSTQSTQRDEFHHILPSTSTHAIPPSEPTADKTAE